MKSLRVTIILITLAIIFLTLAGTMIVTVQTFKAYYTEAWTAKSEIFGQNVQSIVDSLLLLGLQLDHLEGMNDKLRELVTHTKGIAYCHIYDAHSRLLYAADTALAQRLAFPPFPAAALQNTPFLTQQYTATGGDVYYDTVFPLATREGQYLGILRVGFPAQVISEKITTLLMRTATIGVASFLVAAAVFILFSWRAITRPISRLLAATQAMAGGDLHGQLQGLPDNELGTLAGGFNQMAQNLSALIAELEYRNEFAKSLISTRDLDMLLNMVVTGVAESGPYDRVRLYLYDDVRQSLVCRAAFGMAEEHRPFLEIPLDGTRGGVSQWVFVQRAPYVVTDATTDEKCNPQITAMLGVTSYVVVPLLAGEKAIGVVSVDNQQTCRPFSQDRIDSLVAFANTAALATDNALLYLNLEERVKDRTRQLEIANERLQASDRIKSDFLSTVSHELRTPLTSILGFSKMLARRFQDVLLPHLDQTEARVRREAQRVQENLGIIVEEGERLTRLINDVLDLAKIEAGKVEWQMTAVSLRDVCQSAINSTAALARDKGLRVQLVTHGDHFQVYGDHDRLVQVVTNLLSNAIKFTAAGDITCSVEGRASDVLVQVRDTGIGMAPEDVPKVFEKFTQVGDTLTDKPRGTGLGLSICKEIIDHHEGTIWAQSVLGSGSTFLFALPLPAHAGEPIETPSIFSQVKRHLLTRLPRQHTAPLLLIVDDDRNFRLLLRHELEGVGYRIIEAQNGNEAVSMARQEKPDLVILDLIMPGLDGFDVTRILKHDADTAQIPILILSIIEDKEKGYRLGVDSYLTKPVEAEHLLTTVAALVAQGPQEEATPQKILVITENSAHVPPRSS